MKNLTTYVVSGALSLPVVMSLLLAQVLVHVKEQTDRQA